MNLLIQVLVFVDGVFLYISIALNGKMKMPSEGLSILQWHALQFCTFQQLHPMPPSMTSSKKIYLVYSITAPETLYTGKNCSSPHHHVC